MKIGEAKSNKYGDNYSINQCSFMVRVDDQSVEIPLNFGLTSDEIKRLYPFILQFASLPVKNPTIAFTHDKDTGKFVDMSDEELEKLQHRVNEQSRYWYNKSEASVLDIAMRFALDIQLKGVAELSDLFAPISPIDVLDKKNVEPMTSEEVEEYVQEMGLETAVDREYDPGDEQDIDYSAAQGNVHINMYEPGDDEDDFITSELAAMESKLGFEDKFEKTISEHIEDHIEDKGGEESYISMRDLTPPPSKNGTLAMYSDDDLDSSIFDDDTDLDDPVSQDISEPDGFDDGDDFMEEPDIDPDGLDFNSEDED